ncbi:MAG: DUF302 domain-containing protein [Proteobacteria bacterium]|nr:DUF302 domain-containing protein [Pseudomonadota bacterium]MDA1331137.1 DUF302 domain-containing protein [Pseudomonadota bacterium]
MRNKIYLTIFVIYVSALFSTTSNANDVAELVTVVPIGGAFSDVRDRVIFAVESQGLVVDHVSDVGGMLFRTGKDLGENETIYENAEVLEFCSALYSRRMAEFAPAFLAFCPYAISVYTLYGEPHITYVAFKRIARNVADDKTREVLQQIDDLLKDIVREASL